MNKACRSRAEQSISQDRAAYLAKRIKAIRPEESIAALGLRELVKNQQLG